MLMLFCAASISAQAQTTNTGMLYVSFDTEFSSVGNFDNTATAEFYNDGGVSLYANFNNDGTVDHYQPRGITRFVGNQPQSISGSQESYFFSVHFNNASAPAPFQLSGSMNISGTSNFTDGIVNNDTYGGEIIFLPGATPINTSDESHVDGKVTKYGNTAFTFPNGNNGHYVPVEISNFTGPEELVTAQYLNENSNTLYPHLSKSASIDLIDDQEYWVVEKATTEDDMLLTLSWSTATTPANILATPLEDAIHIVRWDETENKWVDEGGFVNQANQTVTTATKGYGIFTLARVKPERIATCDFEIFNAVTPNDDGTNDYFRINKTNVTCGGNMKNVHVQIFNRWGAKVFETSNYDTDGNVFKGYSTGNLSIGNGKLPSGTYFYILTYDYVKGTETHKGLSKAGYLYLSGN